jgi:hypothetical protein
MDDLSYDVLKGRVRAFHQRSILGSSPYDASMAKALLTKPQETSDKKQVGPCFKCNEFGHLFKDCPQHRNKPNPYWK